MEVGSPTICLRYLSQLFVPAEWQKEEENEYIVTKTTRHEYRFRFQAQTWVQTLVQESVANHPRGSVYSILGRNTKGTHLLPGTRIFGPSTIWTDPPRLKPQESYLCVTELLVDPSALTNTPIKYIRRESTRVKPYHTLVTWHWCLVASQSLITKMWFKRNDNVRLLKTQYHPPSK